MKKWLKAARLRTLPLASSSVLTAGAVYNGLNASFNMGVFLLALFTAIALQVLSNFANDLGDFQKGSDNDDRVGPKRSVQSGEISLESMKKAVWISAGISLILGLSLLWFSLADSGYFKEAFLLLTIGLFAIAAAIKYTMGKSAYGYLGLGDLAVFLFFGLVSVLGTYYLMDPTNDNLFEALPSAIMIGLYSTAVLNLNNLRDHENDRSVGKNTMVVFLGFERAKLYHLFLISLAICTTVYTSLLIPSHVSLIAILSIFPLLIHVRKVLSNTIPRQLDSELKKVALTCFAVSLIFFIVSFF
jgi:1,4-dihydroxy-2-naphthoate octaprenyltransferase